jgi:DNA repair exonuclease SbcCD nuclease subunit
MKLLHTADIHIGACRKFPNYLDRWCSAVAEIHELCSTHKVDVLVCSGDILDGTNPTLEERNLVSRLVDDAPCPVALMPGNHEFIGPGWKDHSLSWLFELGGRLEKVNVKLWDTPTVKQWLGAWWVVLPSFPSKEGWNSPSFYLVTQSLLAKIPRDTDLPIIGVAHEFFDGASVDTGYSGKGRCKLPKIRRVSYWALGDVHKRQELFLGAWYCGSPLQKDFGEKRPKGVNLVEVDKESSFVTFLPLQKPTPLRVLKGVPKKWPDAYIKLHCNLNSVPASLPENVVDLVHVGTELVENDPARDMKMSNRQTLEDREIVNAMRLYLKSQG